MLNCLIEQKKDPGIPNAWPFKLEMLEEAKLQKEKRDKLKEEQKLARQQGVQKRRREMLIPATTGGQEKPSFADVQQMARDAAKREKVSGSHPILSIYTTTGLCFQSAREQ